jgi:hypothetical protein
MLQGKHGIAIETPGKQFHGEVTLESINVSPQELNNLGAVLDNLGGDPQALTDLFKRTDAKRKTSFDTYQEALAATEGMAPGDYLIGKKDSAFTFTDAQGKLRTFYTLKEAKASAGKAAITEKKNPFVLVDLRNFDDSAPQVPLQQGPELLTTPAAVSPELLAASKANEERLLGQGPAVAPAADSAAQYDDEVFVFGSNQQGVHGRGAALTAKQQHGAVQGVGEGVTGKAYALPTKATPGKSLSLNEVAQHVYKLIAHAAKNPRTKFRLTKIGTGLAGHSEADIAKLFAQAPANVVLIDNNGNDISPASEWAKTTPTPITPGNNPEVAKLSGITTPSHAQAFTTLLDTVIAKPAKALLGRIKQYTVLPKGRRKGQWDEASQTLSLSEEVLDGLATNQPRAEHILNHELGHTLDYSRGTLISTSAPEFALNPAKLKMAGKNLVMHAGWGGPLMEELFRLQRKAMQAKESDPLRNVHAFERQGFNLLKDAIEQGDASLFAKTQSEVFAQAHAIFQTNPALLKREAPQTHAYFTQLYSRGVSSTTAGSVHNGVPKEVQPASPVRRVSTGQPGTDSGTSAQGKQTSPGTSPGAVGGVAKPFDLAKAVEEDRKITGLSDAEVEAQYWAAANENRDSELTARLSEEVDKRGLILFSKRTGSGHTVESFKAELTKVLGKALADRILSRPNLHILADTKDAPFAVSPDTAGLYLPTGEVYFFASNIGKGEAFGKLVHEVGAHYGLQRMVGKEAYDSILKELQRMHGAEGYASVKAAYARAVKALGDANHP